MPITEILAKNARLYPDDVSLVEINPELQEKRQVTWKEFELIETNPKEHYRKEITWKEFDDESEVIARAFMSLGLTKGSHISIWATNLPEWLLTFFASAKMGAIAITVNTSYKIFELEYQLRQSDTDAIILIDGFKGTSYIDIMNELCPTLKDSEPGNLNEPSLPRLKTVIYAGQGDCPAGMVNWSDLYKLADKVSYDEFKELKDSCTCHETVNIQYTSGTTGFPKGVMLTHKNLVSNVKMSDAWLYKTSKGEENERQYKCNKK